MAQPVESQWDYIRDGILKEFPALRSTEGKQTLFQFSGEPTVASWKTGDSSDAFVLANSTPTGIGIYWFLSAFSIYKSYQNYLEAIDGDSKSLQRAIQNSVDPKFQVALIQSGVQQNVPQTSIEELSSAVANWTSRSEDSSPELDITINKKASLDYCMPSTAASPSLGKGPSNISGLQKVLEEKKTVESSIYNVRIQAIGARAFDVTRTGWFDASWLGASNMTLKSASQFTIDDFFGASGTLVLIPLSFFVIYKPKVVITIPDSSYAELPDLTTDTDPITVFGFTFPASARSVAPTTSGAESAMVITLDSFGDVQASPMILGVNSQCFLRETSAFAESGGSITLKNAGAFVATFAVQYQQSGKTKTAEGGDFPYGVTKNVQLPADATSILVTVKIAVFIKTWSVVAIYKYDNLVTKSFEVSGTTLDPVIKEI